MKNERIQGMFFAALGVFIISFDALLIRLANADASVVTFYRGLFMGISMLLIFIFSKKSTNSLKSWNKKQFLIFFLLIFFSALGTCLFVFSVKYTTAANTVVLLATSAFFAAIFSFIFLKEKINKYTLMAIFVSFIGIFIIFGSGVSFQGNLGDLLGVFLAIVMGLELTLLRKYSNFSKVLIISLSGFLIAIAMFIANQNIFDITLSNFYWLFLMGFIQIPLAMYFIFLSTKYITSAEVSLFSTIETTFAPIWLWIFLNELPPNMTVIGGSLVVLAIFINAIPNLKKKNTFI